jgi:hypothetical protein
MGCVRNLADELHQLVREAMSLRDTLSQGRLAMGSQWLLADIFTASVEATLLSSLTLVYRALPCPGHQGKSISDECIEAARAALRTHRQTMEVLCGNLRMKLVYLHWFGTPPRELSTASSPSSFLLVLKRSNSLYVAAG